MKLRELREAKKIQQRDLAKMVGTDSAMMSRYETYKCLPTPKMMDRITKVLDCKVTDIYERREYIFTKAKKRSKKSSSDRYHLSGYIPARARVDLPKMLEALKYESITSWLNDCYTKLESEYKLYKETNNDNKTSRDA